MYHLFRLLCLVNSFMFFRVLLLCLVLFYAFISFGDVQAHCVGLFLSPRDMVVLCHFSLTQGYSDIQAGEKYYS